MVVVRVKHVTDGLGQVFLLHGLLVITFIEGVQVEGVDRLCVPDAQSVDYVVTVAHNRQIVRNGHNRLITLLNEMFSSVLPDGAHVTAEFDLGCVLGAAYLKGVAVL